jgi:pyridoxamine 5'-phosphate oxidase
VDLENLRMEYLQGQLDPESLSPSPFQQFAAWLEAALAANLPEPHGMILSTVSAQGRPSSRVVLLRSHGEEGFFFFSNYLSRKGRELGQNPQAALNFWWPQLERQVRIEGRVQQAQASRSDRYFASRPYESQAASAASPQSQAIPSREFLLERIEMVKAQFPQSLPRPEHWGGYQLMPDCFEFWQGRQSRIHDRFAYKLQEDGSWSIERLAP